MATHFKINSQKINLFKIFLIVNNLRITNIILNWSDLVKKLNKEVGNYCEDLAKNYLKQNNYRILDCNFRTFSGEIDITCIKNSLLIIVEVKGRYNYDYGLPKESINFAKQKSIINVTKSYISYKKLFNANVRFDIIEIYLNPQNTLFKINHIIDAFRL